MFLSLLGLMILLGIVGLVVQLLERIPLVGIFLHLFASTFSYYPGTAALVLAYLELHRYRSTSAK